MTSTDGSTSGPPHGGPLAGFKVLDLTHFINGPGATRTLCDYGATVIKVEHPTGDDLRDAFKSRDGYNVAKEYFTRGKKSITLDLKNPASKPVMEKLVKWCDVLTENYKPGTLDDWGYTYEWCQTINPQIIYCTNSGFGNRGPMAKNGSFDSVAQAFAGVMHSQGGGPSYRPQPVDFAFSDELGAMSFAQGILMAIIHRLQTGRGQRMDTGQVGATLQFQQLAMAGALHKNGVQADFGGVTVPKWAANYYKGSDGKWFLIQPRNFMGMLLDIGAKDLHDEPRMKTPRDRTKNQDWIEEELTKVFATRARQDWITIFEKGGHPCGPVHTYKEVMNHEQIWANGYLVKQTTQVPGGKAEGEVVMGKVFRFSDSPAGPVEIGPELGENNNEIFKGLLGMTDAEVGKLAEAKAIRTEPVKSKL